MTEYIKQFLERFSYSDEDSQILLDTYKKISDSKDAKAWDGLLSLYDADAGCDCIKFLETSRDISGSIGIHQYTSDLLFLICLSRSTEKHYAKKGISNSVFENTMKDLCYKLEECKIIHGICGTSAAAWQSGHFNLTRFALGRLQFELTDFGRNYSKDGRSLSPKSTVINVHIPRTGTPLLPSECDEAFDAAAEFFQKQIEGETAFVCNSWLLYPEHEKLLSESSNILHFMRRFDIIESSEHDNGYPELWRIFDMKYNGDPDSLPCDSSLRRAYVKHLKEGRKTGKGFGVFFL